MSFRIRLSAFMVVALIVVQMLTALLIYDITRRQAITEGGRQLQTAAAAFARQLDAVSQRVADSVQVLALDYALRASVAQGDQATVLSALRNHGRRVAAARMLLIGLDGSIGADTAGASPGGSFPHPDLVNRAMTRPATSIVTDGREVQWMVAVPVFAPALTGLIAAAIPVNDALLAELQEQTALLPRDIELATRSGAGAWQVAARGQGGAALALSLMQDMPDAAGEPQRLTVGGREYVALAVNLAHAGQGSPVMAVLGYSVDDALAPYRSVATAWASLVALGLVAGLVGAALIAGTVSRPIEALAAAARRIAHGDYQPPAPAPRQDEIGDLTVALSSMAAAIHEREQRILHQSEHDEVTGLPNRHAAERRVGAALQAQPARPGALLMIGLTRLPEIVKTAGHAIADRLIRDAALRMLPLVGGGLLARAADNELLLWLPDTDKAAAIGAAFRVIDALGAPYQEPHLTMDSLPAIGIALHPLHGAQASMLLQHAQVALFAAMGVAEPVVIYDPASDPHAPDRLSLMGDLREALGQRQLELHYQPKLDLRTRCIDGAEGLVRWQHPRRGAVPPDLFIRLAEDTGNIRLLTRWALASGIAQAEQWCARNWPFKVAINVSAHDLSDAELPRRIGELLTTHRVPARCLTLEITESAVMADPDRATGVLRQLADQGIDIAIDDFGVGQSSFAYLHRLPARELKIDRIFVRNLTNDPENQVIVHSMVDLGHRLGHRVTAEGVEDGPTLEFLAAIGCDHAQGFYISKALPAPDFDRFVAASAWSPGILRETP